jgi:hypothetical protein
VRLSNQQLEVLWAVAVERLARTTSNTSWKQHPSLGMKRK